MSEPDYLGEIRMDTDAPAISHERWLEVIGRFPGVTFERRFDSLNPFTGQPLSHQRARLMIGGGEVAEISWSQTDKVEIHVFGDPDGSHADEMVALVSQIALALGGRFERSR